MPLIDPTRQICAGELIDNIGDASCPGAVGYEWTQVGGPASSVVQFQDDDLAIISATFPNPGRYTLKRCCFFEQDNPAEPPSPFLSVADGIYGPTGAVNGGEPILLTLTGCEDGNVLWSTANTSVTIVPISNTAAQVSFTGAGIGTVGITATCVRPGQPDVLFQHQVVRYPEGQEFATESVGAITLNSYECGERCICQTVDILVDDCGIATKSPLKVIISEKEDLPPVEKPEVVMLEPVRLQGSPLPSYTPIDVIEKACEENKNCDPHVPVIYWNDAFNCGWSIEASQAVNGTNIYNALSYNVGGKWCFMGPATFTLSGPPAFFDTLILWGHNMIDASITTSPLVPFGGGPTSTGVFSDKSCLEGFTVPVNIQFNDVQDNITSLTVTITPADPTRVTCIQNIFLGLKLPLTEMPDDWKNPFFGSDREVLVREGSCGPMSVTAKRRRIPLSIPIHCITESEYKECIIPLLRYLACPNPLLFSWSINQCPHHVFYGWTQGINDGATYLEGCFPENTIEALGFITQPQPKDFA